MADSADRATVWSTAFRSSFDQGHLAGLELRRPARRGPIHRSPATGSRTAPPRAGFDFPFGPRRRVRGRAVQDAARSRWWHGADELGELRIDGRTTGSTSPRLPVPERAEALPVPANHGLRLNDMERFAPPCPPLREPHPEDAVEETDRRSLGAAAEQGELLPER